MSAVSANLSVKVVRNAFKSAIRERLVTENPAAKEFIDGSKRRTVHALSFHSLRHTTTSILKNAGVNSAIVMDVDGHLDARCRGARLTELLS